LLALICRHRWIRSAREKVLYRALYAKTDKRVP
jgi:hypothetical protein